MTQASEFSVISEAYAKAIFSLALEQNIIDDVNIELDYILAASREEKVFLPFLSSPYFDIESKKKLLEKVFQGRLTELTANFLFVVVKNDRAKYIPQIISEYGRLWLSSYDCLPIVATVSEKFNDEQKRDLHNRISAAVKKDIELKIVVDPSIIGGIIIRFGDNLIDNSVRKRLIETVKTIKYNCSHRGRIDEI